MEKEFNVQIETEYNIGEKIKIKPLEYIDGRIKSISINQTGILYEVRYFHDGGSYEVFFYEDELC